MSKMFYLFVLLLLFPLSPGYNHTTSCQTRKYVFEGESSVITCHYAYNLRLSQISFGVTRHDLDGLDGVGDLIMSCLWNPAEHNPSCAIKEEYKATLFASGKIVTLEIEKTQKQHAGRYTCRDALTFPDDQGNCTLAIQGGRIFCTVSDTTVSVGASAGVTCYFNSDLRITREKFYVYRFHDDERLPDEVAYCTWNTPDVNGEPRCRVKPGYQLETANIGTNATLFISSAEERHSGRYSCRTISPNENVNITDCSLDVKEMTTTEMTSVESTGVMNPQNQSLSNVRCQSNKCVRKSNSAEITLPIPENVDVEAEVVLARANSTSVKSLNGSTFMVIFSEKIINCSGKSGCYVKNGYGLIKTITHFGLQIPNVTEQHFGVYTITVNTHKTRMVCVHLVKGEVTDNQCSSGAAHRRRNVIIIILILCLPAIFLILTELCVVLRVL